MINLLWTYFWRSACSFSSGSIFSITFEYWTFALHHAASGAAAWDALFAFLKNKVEGKYFWLKKEQKVYKVKL